MESQEMPWSAKLLREMRALEGRDVHLWSLGVMVLLVVAAGFAALVVPNLVWGAQDLRVDARYFPQLFYGFVTLILLFNVYALNKKKELRHARDELVHQLVRSEVAEMTAVKDPLTDAFNRRYFDQIIQGEVNRANRRSSELGIIIIDVDDFKSVNTRFGHLAGDQVLISVVQMLNRTFRSCDVVIRYGGDEFLVLVTDSTEEGAKIALERLRQRVDAWNSANLVPGYRLALSCGVAGYSKGMKIQDVVELADERMFVEKRSKCLPDPSVRRMENVQVANEVPVG
jgi:diguanylate cyclase (GGDEF)-like protein